jgi:hypothetical protein
MKTGPDAHGTAKNDSRNAKHENGTRRPGNRQKRVRQRKTWKQDPMLSAPPKMCPLAQNMKTGPDALRIA